MPLFCTVCRLNLCVCPVKRAKAVYNISYTQLLSNLELLGRFELPTSSLPTTAEPSSPCCIRLCGVFLSKKDEVAACLFHCFRPLISPCGSRCGSKLLHLIKKRRQNIKYDRTDDCPVRILIIMHKLKSSPARFSFQKCSPSFK